MKSFVLKKINSDNNLEYFDYNNKGLVYKVKNEGALKEIIIYNPMIIDSLISHSFNKRYKKILEFFWETIQDENDDNEGNIIIVLDEIAKLRNILLKRYNNLLNQEKLNSFLKHLKLLENEVRAKIVNIRLIKEQELINIHESEKCKSR